MVLKDIRPASISWKIADIPFGLDSAFMPNDYQSHGGFPGVVLKLGRHYLSWIHYPFLRKDGWYKAGNLCEESSSGRLDSSVEVEIGKIPLCPADSTEGEEEKAFHAGTFPCPWAECWSWSHRCFIP